MIEELNFGCTALNKAIQRFRDKNKRDPDYQETNIIISMLQTKLLESIEDHLNVQNGILRDIRSNP